jgi:hypothetical protein
MPENIIENTNYKGFIVQQVRIETGSGLVQGGKTVSPFVPHSYTQWRITKPGIRPGKFVNAISKEDAHHKIDTGQAARELV